MKISPNLEHEFEELCAEYSSHDSQGRDIVFLVKEFGDRHHGLSHEPGPHFAEAWSLFLEEHKHHVTVGMVGMILYVLVTYWDMGASLFESLPPLEKILLRDSVQDISDEIQRRSANGNEPA